MLAFYQVPAEVLRFQQRRRGEPAVPRPSADIEKGLTMNIRKMSVVTGLAVAAALAFAPLAAADDLTTTVDSEIASLNSIFETEAAIAGDSADVVKGATGVFDTIPLADAPVTAPLTTLDYELYGPFAWALDLDPNPGAYDVFNGALVEFDDAYNAIAYSLLNDQAMIPTTDLLGAADVAVDDGSLTDAALFGSFFDTGITDLISAFSAGALG